MKKRKKGRRGFFFLTFQVHDVSAVDTAETKALTLAHRHFHLDSKLFYQKLETTAHS